MNRIWLGAFLLTILVVSVVAIKIMRIGPRPNDHEVMPVVGAASGAELAGQLPPDFEDVPFYSDMRIVEINDDSVQFRRVIYETPDTKDELVAFYRSVLPNFGWVPLTTDQFGGIYSRTGSPAESPWHLQLDIAVGETLTDTSHVSLIVSRYPDIRDNLPVYADAEQIEISSSEEEGDPKDGGFPKHLIRKTYLTSATRQDIADFYNNNLLNHGWMTLNTENILSPASQTGDINTEEGLWFRAVRHSDKTNTAIVTRLNITAHNGEAGKLWIQLRVADTEKVTFYP